LKSIFINLTIFIYFILFMGCNETLQEYPYWNELKLYLNREFDIDWSCETNLYVMDLEGCTNCVRLNLEMIKENFYQGNINKSLLLIFIGDPIIPYLQELVQDIKKMDINIIHDKDSRGLLYELGLSKPLFISCNQNTDVKYFIISDDKIHKTGKLFKQNE
jgi:hypothetical protein